MCFIQDKATWSILSFCFAAQVSRGKRRRSNRSIHSCHTCIFRGQPPQRLAVCQGQQHTQLACTPPSSPPASAFKDAKVLQAQPECYFWVKPRRCNRAQKREGRGTFGTLNNKPHPSFFNDAVKCFMSTAALRACRMDVYVELVYITHVTPHLQVRAENTAQAAGLGDIFHTRTHRRITASGFIFEPTHRLRSPQGHVASQQ